MVGSQQGACPWATSMTRRRVLQLAAAGGGAVATVAIGGAASAAPPQPFAHGVASGDPYPDSVVLWTRVTPQPDATPGSGIGPNVAVLWEVAADSDFRRVVRRGIAGTGSARDHTVKVEATGLQPATDYWYRFSFHTALSAVGRTRTAPMPDADVRRLRIAVVSCANLQAGWFTAYRHLAAGDDLDLVVHLGDYFYEYEPGRYQARDVLVRPHDPPHETVTLSDYRRRHAQYKRDPDLQALHAAAPWVVTWDDHESANDASEDGAQNHTEGVEGEWGRRRWLAHQAYAEWMPVRYEPAGVLYRRLRFGRLASLSMLDLRTYRDAQTTPTFDAPPDDPERTLTGPEQLDFLLDGLSEDAVQWKLVGNPVLIAPLRFPSTVDTAATEGIRQLVDGEVMARGTPLAGGVPYNVDQWDGYPAERARVLDHLRDGDIRDVVFLTGDMHAGWAIELPKDPETYARTGDSLAVELACTSVTCDNLDDFLRAPPRTVSLAVEHAMQMNNPHVKYLDFDSNGFSLLEVTPEWAQMDWFTLIDRRDPYSGAVWSTSYRVMAGTGKIRSVPRRPDEPVSGGGERRR